MIFLTQNPKEVRSAPGELKVSYQLGVALYGYAGNKRVETKVHALTANERSVVIDMESRGNALSRLDARYAIWPQGKAPGLDQAARLLSQLEKSKPKQVKAPSGAIAFGSLPGLPVLPGTRRQLKTHWPSNLDPGDYELVVSGKAGERSLLKSVRFSVGKS